MKRLSNLTKTHISMLATVILLGQSASVLAAGNWNIANFPDLTNQDVLIDVLGAGAGAGAARARAVQVQVNLQR